MPLKLNSASGSVTLTPEDGSGNVDVTVPRGGIISDLSDLSITATASEINTLDGITATVDELNYVDGVTSAIQTQIDGKSGYAEIAVTVSGGKFYLDGTQQQKARLTPSVTYRFDQSDSSNASHPLLLSTTSDGTHGGGSAFTTGVTTVGTAGSAGAYVEVTLEQDAPYDLYYYCSNHSGMGAGIEVSANNTLADFDVTASAAELNILDGATLTTAELNYVDGVTSNIQTQLDAKGTVSSLSDLSITATASELNILDGATLTTTELNYVDGVTSAIQTQIDTKAPTASPTFTGSITGANLTLSGDLTVNGTTTTVNSTNTVVSDGLLELANGTTGTPANDTGIVIERGDNDNAFIGFDESADKFIVGTGSFTGASTGNLTVSTGTLVANVEGNVTGNVTGNADTATALATGRTISLTGDVTGTSASFDGSGNVSITATIADDSHNHVISNVDGLQTALDAKAPTANPTFTGTVTAGDADITNSQNAETKLDIVNTNTGSAAQVRTAYTTDGGLFTVGKTSDAHAFGGDAYIYNVDNTNIRIATSDIEAMRIDSGQNVFIGKTTFGNNTAGHQIEKTGLLRSTRDQNESAIFNRTTNDGDIVTIKKDDATVGNLKSDGGKLVVNSEGSNLVFAIGGTNEANIDASQFYPNVNGGLDLGHPTLGWGRLRLTKGVVENTVTVTYASSIALSYTNGSIQSVTLTGNVTFTDSLLDGEAIVLMLDGGASYTVTWTAVTKWVTGSGNAAPTLTANDTIVLWKIGSSVYAAYTGSYT